MIRLMSFRFDCVDVGAITQPYPVLVDSTFQHFQHLVP